jgi:glycerol-3-phosphate acyltransferase PlsY
VDPADGLRLGLVVIVGYALGSLPVSPLIGRRAGVDIYRDGDQNPGASNVWRLAGARAGLVASVADLAKGTAAGAVGWLLLGFGGAWAAGAAAIVGASWPAFGRLPGGRAVAVSGGVLLALAPVAGVAALGVMALVAVVAAAVGRDRRASARIGIGTAFAAYPVLFRLVDQDLGHLAAVMTLYLLALGRWLATRACR